MPAPTAARGGSDRSTPPLVRLWRYARGHRRRAVVATVMSVLNTVFDLAPPFLIGIAVDIVVVGETSFVARLTGVTDLRRQLVVLAAITVVVWLLESLTEYVADVLWRNLAQTIEHEARLDAYAHVQAMDLASFEDRSTGGLLAVLNDDVNQLERFLDRGAFELIHVATSVVLIGATYVALAPVIGVLAFLPVPAVLWGTLHFQQRLAPRYASVRERVADLNATLANDLTGIATIKAFAAEDRELERVRAASQAYREANREAIRLSSAFVPLIRLAILAGFTAILVLGGLQARGPDRGRRLQRDGVHRAAAAVAPDPARRDLRPLPAGHGVDRSGPRPPRRTHHPARRARAAADPRGEVRFEGVRFRYRTGEAVLRGVDLHVPAGDTHAIVGPTGAGKSTIVKLVLRLEDVTGGRVVIDGHDVRDLVTADLRAACALVSQDVFLFHGTVRENLVYGRPEATDAEVEAAARLAEAHDFVAALPEGYDTVVGERGQKLSGGQRQRLSIARAILADPAILVLDEATSAVDNETEAAIQRSLARVTHTRTTLVIAHRLSTVRHADRIHVLEDGEVVEAGTHEELLVLGGRYAALWRVQTGDAAIVAIPPSGPDPGVRSGGSGSSGP
jgi:ATP-binding cassette, subfamily B, bacterial